MNDLTIEDVVLNVLERKIYKVVSRDFHNVDRVVASWITFEEVQRILIEQLKHGKSFAYTLYIFKNKKWVCADWHTGKIMDAITYAKKYDPSIVIFNE